MYRADDLTEWRERIWSEMSGLGRKRVAHTGNVIFARDLGYSPSPQDSVARCLAIVKMLRSKRKNMGYIYFIASEDGRVKIGYSKNPKARLANMQTGSSSQLKIIALSPANQVEERKLHQQFDEYRVHREWFRFEGALREFIEKLNG
jgi:hypothetical protein